MRARLFGIALALIAFSASAQQKSDQSPPRQKTEHYACPPAKTIDCMPIVPKDRQAYCRKDYLDWAKKNCPGLEVTY